MTEWGRFSATCLFFFLGAELARRFDFMNYLVNSGALRIREIDV
jgi:hypothetical protein